VIAVASKDYIGVVPNVATQCIVLIHAAYMKGKHGFSLRRLTRDSSGIVISEGLSYQGR